MKIIDGESGSRNQTMWDEASTDGMGEIGLLRIGSQCWKRYRYEPALLDEAWSRKQREKHQGWSLL